MEYEMRIKFSALSDDAAKEILEETLNEVDVIYNVTSKGELFYNDGETRVP